MSQDRGNKFTPTHPQFDPAANHDQNGNVNRKHTSFPQGSREQCNLRNTQKRLEAGAREENGRWRGGHLALKPNPNPNPKSNFLMAIYDHRIFHHYLLQRNNNSSPKPGELKFSATAPFSSVCCKCVTGGQGRGVVENQPTPDALTQSLFPEAPSHPKLLSFVVSPPSPPPGRGPSCVWSSSTSARMSCCRPCTCRSSPTATSVTSHAAGGQPDG